MITPLNYQIKKPIYNKYKDENKWPVSTRTVKPVGIKPIPKKK